MNRKYAKPKADNAPEFAPDAVVIDGRTILAPKAVHYAKAGFLPLKDERPADAPDGKHWERQATIEADGDGYRWVYALVDNPPPAPRVFSKLKCVAVLMQAGVWAEVRSWIEAAGLYDLYLAAQDFREDNEYFVRGREQLQAVLGWSDEQIEAILKECAIGY